MTGSSNESTRQTTRIRRAQPSGDARRALPTPRKRRRTARTSDRSVKELTLPHPYASISEVPNDLLLRALEKEGWIQRFIAEGCPRGKLVEYASASAVARGMEDEPPPPYTTLHTWVRRYRAHGLLGLVDAPSSHAGRSRRLDETVKPYFEDAATCGWGATTILRHLARVLPPNVPLPSRPVIWRALKRFEAEEPHLVAMARKGPTWFRDHHELALSHGLLPGGMRLAMDSTVLDIWVKVREGGTWVPRRPVFTVLMDVGSRLLITFNLSLLRIDAGICLGILGRAFDPTLNHPGLPCVHAPHEITLDKGAEHQAVFRRRLDSLGIRVVPRQDNNPRGGAHVERLIRTVTEEVLTHLRGYSKTERPFDPYAPADRDMKRSVSQLKYDPYRAEVPVEVLSTLRELEEDILAWALVYNERPHRSLPVDDPTTQAVLAGIQWLATRSPVSGDGELQASRRRTSKGEVAA